jgi:hypothetical protein
MRTATSAHLPMRTSEQANKQTSEQANKETSEQANKRTIEQANKRTRKQANKRTSKQANKRTSEQANKRTNEHANKRPFLEKDALSKQLLKTVPFLSDIIKIFSCKPTRLIINRILTYIGIVHKALPKKNTVQQKTRTLIRALYYDFVARRPLTTVLCLSVLRILFCIHLPGLGAVCAKEIEIVTVYYCTQSSTAQTILG